jgi:hypothetical protein
MKYRKGKRHVIGKAEKRHKGEKTKLLSEPDLRTPQCSGSIDVVKSSKAHAGRMIQRSER